MTTPETDEFKSERFAAHLSLQQMYAEKWIDISLDTDRQLLTLSTAAIGLLAAFITTKGVSSSFQLLLIFASVACFVSVIGGLLYVFKLNRNFLAVQGAGQTPDESLMLFLDKAIRVLFFVGIFGTSVYALSIAIHDVEKSNSPNQGVTSESKSRNSEESSGPLHRERKLGRENSDGGQRQPGRDEESSSGDRSNDQRSLVNSSSSTKHPGSGKSSSELE